MSNDTSTFDFEFVEKFIRKKSFGVLSTVSPRGWSQSTGVLYGVSQQDSQFGLYIQTARSHRKTQNILENSKVSFVITFPHYWLRFVPANTVAFQAKAEVLPNDHEDARLAYQQKRILRMVLEDDPKEDYVFLKLIPHKRLNVYGVGIPVLKIRGGHTTSNYRVEIPENRK